MPVHARILFRDVRLTSSAHFRHELAAVGMIVEHMVSGANFSTWRMGETCLDDPREMKVVFTKALFASFTDLV